ncbi:MAG: hypothetical protein IPL65_10820 [Lewinellaceae bacterium]|nr:hypothetical protein [Lewinellaceae bacterium]
MAKIFCLEGEWKNDPRNKHSVASVLEFIQANTGIAHTHRRVSTVSELESRLDEFNRQSSYTMLYLAFPGTAGALMLREQAYSLEDLALASKGRWKDRVIHLSVENMLKVPTKQITAFRLSTHATILSGYTGSIDFFPSAILEMCYIEVLRQYKTPAAIRSHLEAAQKPWIRKAGFKIYP